MLSERDGMRLLLGCFVNPHGIAGNNKAADMQQENNIKDVKSVIRGLGAYKTETSIHRVSKAATVVSRINKDLAQSLGLKNSQTFRVKKSSKQDIEFLLNTMENLTPFKLIDGRKMINFNSVSESFIKGVNKSKLSHFAMRHAYKSITNIPVNDDDEMEI
jgi:hypothetical protein